MTDRPNSSFQWEADEDGNVFALTPDGRRPVGTMVTAEHARDAAEGHNSRLAASRGAGHGATFQGVTGLQVGDGNTQIGHFY